MDDMRVKVKGLDELARDTLEGKLDLQAYNDVGNWGPYHGVQHLLKADPSSCLPGAGLIKVWDLLKYMGLR